MSPIEAPRRRLAGDFYFHMYALIPAYLNIMLATVAATTAAATTTPSTNATTEAPTTIYVVPDYSNIFQDLADSAAYTTNNNEVRSFIHLPGKCMTCQAIDHRLALQRYSS